jgi:tRNA threonylcarbamoyladenosine biosynthesis protein TsaB
MSVRILQINTALQEASVSVSADGVLLGERINPAQQEHAGFLQPAIAELFDSLKTTLKDLDAVSVVNGPGSYTGLRVGLSAAKGICYALNLPLILVNTLEWMAKCTHNQGIELVCPMIDARRMEVFTALYDQSLHPVMDPQAMILDPSSFSEILSQKSIAFMGDGAKKWQGICQDPHAIFPETNLNAQSLSQLSLRDFTEKKFADLAYCEPFYTKDFHTGK